MAVQIRTRDHFPAQYSVSSDLIHVVQLIKKKLTDHDLKLFKATSFGHLLDVPTLQFSGQIIHFLLLHLLREQPEDELWIYINGDILKFNFEEWCRITGLPQAKEYPTFGEEESKADGIRSRFLGGSSNKCSYAYLRECYAKLDHASNPSNDLLKFSMLYFVESVLLTKDKGTCVELSHLQLIDEPQKFNAYPWAWESYILTVRHMKHAMVGQPEKFNQKKSVNPKIKTFKYGLYGFPQVLQVWAYEKFPRLADEVAEHVGDADCAMLNWASDKCPQYNTIKELVFTEGEAEDGNKLENALELVFRELQSMKQSVNTRLDLLEGKVDALAGNVHSLLKEKSKKSRDAGKDLSWKRRRGDVGIVDKDKDNEGDVVSTEERSHEKDEEDLSLEGESATGKDSEEEQEEVIKPVRKRLKKATEKEVMVEEVREKEVGEEKEKEEEERCENEKEVVSKEGERKIKVEDVREEVVTMEEECVSLDGQALVREAVVQHIQVMVEALMVRLDEVSDHKVAIFGPMFVVIQMVSNHGPVTHKKIRLDTVGKVNVALKHWVLLEIDMLAKELRVYDSMTSARSISIVAQFAQRLPVLLRTVKCTENQRSCDEWKAVVAKEVSQQKIGFGVCGVMVLAFAEYLLAGLPLVPDCQLDHIEDFCN